MSQNQFSPSDKVEDGASPNLGQPTPGYAGPRPKAKHLPGYWASF
ncbi:hypothetical protein [Renibacterium salmoninarum]|nr:hypothetical protein [Renibacterium salmoninarum]